MPNELEPKPKNIFEDGTLDEALTTGDTTKLTEWFEGLERPVIFQAPPGKTVDDPGTTVTEIPAK